MENSLILSNQSITSCQAIEETLLNSASTLIFLDLTNNYLKDFNTPIRFASLQILMLDNNMISSIDNFPIIPELETLSINNNSLSGLSSFMMTCQVKYPNLKSINTNRNPMNPSISNAKDYEGYREIIRKGLKTLVELDGIKLTEPVQAKPVEASKPKTSISNFFSSSVSESASKRESIVGGDNSSQQDTHSQQQQQSAKTQKKNLMFSVDEEEEIDGTDYVNQHKQKPTIMYSERILKKSDNLTKFNRKNHSEGNKHILNSDL